MSEQIEAIHVLTFAIDERRKRGKPGHAEAVKLYDDARALWRKQVEAKMENKCPHCGGELK